MGGGEDYSDNNNRVYGHARLTRLFWTDPDVELGYQFVYDNAEHENPFFYTPDQYIANEAVASFRLGGDRPVNLISAIAMGEGSERTGNPEFEVSAVGGLEIRLLDRVRIVVNGGQTQSAKFHSYEMSGALAVRFVIRERTRRTGINGKRWVEPSRRNREAPASPRMRVIAG